MDYIVIDGVRPWDGRYLFDLMNDELTTREWGWIKRLSGYMPLTLDEGFAGGDPELYAVFATIALWRAGKIESRAVPDVFERIADAPFGSTIRLEHDRDEEEADSEDPPVQRSTGNEHSFGDDSRLSLATSDGTPANSGTPGSGSSVSDPTRLAI